MTGWKFKVIDPVADPPPGNTTLYVLRPNSHVCPPQLFVIEETVRLIQNFPLVPSAPAKVGIVIPFASQFSLIVAKFDTHDPEVSKDPMGQDVQELELKDEQVLHEK